MDVSFCLKILLDHVKCFSFEGLGFHIGFCVCGRQHIYFVYMVIACIFYFYSFDGRPVGVI